MEEENEQLKSKSTQAGHCIWQSTSSVSQQTHSTSQPITPSITSSSNHHANFISHTEYSSQQNKSCGLNALLTTPKRKSLELSQEEKFPDMLIQHTRLLDPSSSSSKRISNRSHQFNSSSQNDIIQEKSEVEEDDQAYKSTINENDNMLFGCIVQVVQCKSEKEKHQHDGVTFYSHQSALPVANEDFSVGSTDKQSKEELKMTEIEDQLNVQNNVPEIICRCALFWRRENCTTQDYRKFGRLISDYVEMRMKPKPLSYVGECLLQNGFFVLAFIKYMSMPESLEEQQACEEALNIQDSLFEIMKKEYSLRSNHQEFQQAYQQTLKRQAHSRKKQITTVQKHEDKNLSTIDLKRDPMLLSSLDTRKATNAQKINHYSREGKLRNEKKSGTKNRDTKTSNDASHDQAVQTDRNL